MITEAALEKFKELYETYCLIPDAVFVLNIGYTKTQDGRRFKSGFYWFGRHREDKQYTELNDLKFDIQFKKEYTIDVDNKGELVLSYNGRNHKMRASFHSFSRSKMFNKETE